jgi:nitroimidazol reductase NimA-like FMN-containing flavoprotein (pyridoxamine 5'-phosphate oxidase superfamily)
MYENVEGGDLSRRQVDGLLIQPVLARLATTSAATMQPHVVPVWFLWDGEHIWISSFSSTRKVRELLQNPHCAVLIDDAAGGVDYWAVLFEGVAELVMEPAEVVQAVSTRIYVRYIGEDGVQDPRPRSWIHDPENLLIKLAPQRTRAWYSVTRGSVLAEKLAALAG